MTKKAIIIYSILFSIIIILANYTVQFPINDWLTYGAIMFPFSFLLSDILSEKYSREEVLKIIKYGILIAVIPTVIIADWRIAFASLSCLIISQQLNVRIFIFLRQKFINLWWLRIGSASIISQLFDTALFFFLAFTFVLPFETIIKLIIGDYLIKVTIALMDTPIFYLIAIRLRQYTFGRI
ncbi:queuosine precursor transporter [Aliarcobacter butzleri]|uniref:queuosine precursor transporter n=1 Tax=Aliarcobacter butzleri TaxID=28197 RepID=UPI003AEF02AE